MKIKCKKYLSILSVLFLAGCAGKEAAKAEYRKIEEDEAYEIASEIMNVNEGDYNTFWKEYHIEGLTQKLYDRGSANMSQEITRLAFDVSVEKQYYYRHCTISGYDNKVEKKQFAFVKGKVIYEVNETDDNGEVTYTAYSYTFNPRKEKDKKLVEYLFTDLAQRGLNNNTNIEYDCYMGASFELAENLCDTVASMNSLIKNGGTLAVGEHQTVVLNKYETEFYAKEAGDLKADYSFKYTTTDNNETKPYVAEVYGNYGFEYEDTLVLNQSFINVVDLTYEDGFNESYTTASQGTMTEEAVVEEIDISGYDFTEETIQSALGLE